MRLKLGLVIVAVFVAFGLLVNAYVIRPLEQDAALKLENSLLQSYAVYQKAQRASREERLDQVRAFAREADILAATRLPAAEPKAAEERHYTLFQKMEVVSSLRYRNAKLFIALDTAGNELARTGNGAWKTTRFGDNKAVREALQGRGVEDIWLLDGKVMIVDVAPVLANGSVIGAMIMGNTYNEDIIKQEKELVFGPFAYFSSTQVLASSLASDEQNELSGYILKNGDKIAGVLMDKSGTPFKERLVLNDKTYVAVFARVQTLSDQGHAGYILLANEDQWVAAYAPVRHFLLIAVILFTIFTIAMGLIVMQKAYNAIDFVLEGAHQIIMGNRDFEFSSRDNYMNQIGQTLNLAIAIMLGKYIPNDEEDAARMAGKGSMGGSTKRFTHAGDQLMIQTMHIEDHEPVAEEGKTHEQLYDEFCFAKKRLGEDTHEPTREQFIQKLKRAEEKLIEAHGCQSVRFEVRTESGKVSLKPIAVWPPKG